ncbi:unnamed protein product [Prorocentrum cordatum]|uniref:Uncharacterized protein n=1 Tax=Prorocentrum cordatum TaxID=2364126 RepID=A0ABN9VJH0_9DINO|nr:unnamed protein product [Polarella glacialis]
MCSSARMSRDGVAGLPIAQLALAPLWPRGLGGGSRGRPRPPAPRGKPGHSGPMRLTSTSSRPLWVRAPVSFVLLLLLVLVLLLLPFVLIVPSVLPFAFCPLLTVLFASFAFCPLLIVLSSSSRQLCPLLIVFVSAAQLLLLFAPALASTSR